jgi:DNA-binding NtrC family response regulator
MPERGRLSLVERLGDDATGAGMSMSEDAETHPDDPKRRWRISGPKRLRDIERAALERTLADTGHNKSETARILGISRPTLARKLQSYRVADAAGRRP